MTDTDQLRELLLRVPPRMAALDADQILAEAAARTVARPGGGHRRVLAVAAAVAVVIAVTATSLVLFRGDGRRGSKPAVPADRRDGNQSLVLHNGDHVHAFGTVESGSGRSTLLCDPDIGVGGVANEPPPQCRPSVALVGADLGRVYRPTTLSGVTRGTAVIDGVWRDGAIRVTGQQPALNDPGANERLIGHDSINPPCKAPSGGWPRTSAVDRTAYAPLFDYNRRHPRTFISFDLFHPTPQQTVVFALGQGDLTAAHKELDPIYQGGLCLVRSVYTPAQIAKARAAVFTGRATRAVEVTSYGPTTSDTGQYVFSINCSRVTPALLQLAETEPPGLIALVPWLRPKR